MLTVHALPAQEMSQVFQHREEVREHLIALEDQTLSFDQVNRFYFQEDEQALVDHLEDQFHDLDEQYQVLRSAHIAKNGWKV